MNGIIGGRVSARTAVLPLPVHYLCDALYEALCDALCATVAEWFQKHPYSLHIIAV